MNKLTQLLAQIKQQIAENNTSLADNCLADLNHRCENISHSLTQIEQALEQFQKLSTGIEVSPEDLRDSLRELNLAEINGESLRTKLEEILSLATDNNQELANKIKETEQELATILTALQHQQTIIANYQAQITSLETKISSNENKVGDLQLKATAIGIGAGGFTAGLLLLMAKFWSNFKKKN